MGPLRPKKKGKLHMKTNSFKIKRMVGIASLTALIVVLQFISNYIQFGSVSITLALIPMVVGAIIYGPLVGFILGLIMGFIILLAPSTALFWNYNAIMTILLCLFKTGLAGLAAGYVYKGIIRIKALKKATFPTAIIVATLVAPLINTGLFILGTSILFQGLSISVDGVTTVLVPSNGGYGAALSASIGFVVLTNFVIEFIISVVLSPSIVYLTKVLGATKDLGFQEDFKKHTADQLDNQEIEG